MLGIEKIEFGRGQRKWFPVEPAFEKEGAAGVFGALEAFLEFGFEAFELFRAEAALASGTDKGAGWAGGIIQ